MATDRRIVLCRLAALALGACVRPAHAAPGRPGEGAVTSLGRAAATQPGEVASMALDAPAAARSGPGVAASDDAIYVTARRGPSGYEAAVLDAAGQDQRIVPLADRGHGAAFDPATGRVVVFGRQPGFFAQVFGLDGRAPAALPLADERHFFGHGVFIDGGRRLLATENDYAAGRGVLGVYDASSGGGYRRLGEWPTGGIGPHEVVALPGTPLVVVANGGLLTHPDYDKMPLNLDSMRPSLAYVDTRTGEVVERVELALRWRHLSIRHLALDARGQVWFGCQFMGAPGELPPLVGRHARGEAPVLLSLPDAAWRPYRQYIGSVAADASGEIIAVSSPLGHRIGYLDARRDVLVGETDLNDGCGVAPTAEPRQFVVSSGHGRLALAGPAQPPRGLRTDADLAWDNHLRRFPARWRAPQDS